MLKTFRRETPRTCSRHTFHVCNQGVCMVPRVGPRVVCAKNKLSVTKCFDGLRSLSGH